MNKTIIDSFPAVVYQLSLQGGQHHVLISEQVSALGLSAEKWGSDAEIHHQMCHQEDRPYVKKELELSYKTGAVFQCEYRIDTPNNRQHWFHDKADVVRDKKGSPLYLKGVMTDISSTKFLQAELIHYHRMVDKLVMQKTERLDKQLAILQACNASLGENYHKMRQLYLDLLVKHPL
ncbi:MAG: PAS domain-containing protein [Gallionellaceae bacterium]